MKKQNYIFLMSLTLILIIVASVFTTITFAKYVKNSSNNDSATVASPVIQFSGLNKDLNTYSLLLDETSPIMSTLDYTFNVNNYLGSIITETALSYTVTLNTTNNIPLIISLKKYNDTTSNFDTLSTLNTSLSTTTTSAYSLKVGEIDTDQFMISVSWDSDYISEEYSGLIDQLNVSINWEQLD